MAKELLARWLSVCLLLAGLVSIAATAPARAATGTVKRAAAVTYAPPSNAGEPLNERFRGVNWERSGDNFTTGDLLQDGLTASDSYGTVYMKATQILTSLKSNLNINTVRLGLNEATVADPWWANYGAVVQAATDLRMNVVLAFWSPSNGSPGSVVPCTDGTFNGCYPVSDYAPWWTMWQKVIGTYASYGNVYLMPFNEAAGYSDTATGYQGPSATQLADLDAAWLAHYPRFPRGRVILGGTGDDYYLTLGHDHRLDGTLLSYHPYCSFGLHFPTEAAWTQWIKGQIAGMESRTVISEFGLGQGSTNFDGLRDGNNCVSYVYAVTDYARAHHLGLIYWDYGSTDSWSVATRTGDGTADSPYVTHIRNQSFVDRLEWGFGLDLPLAPTISSGKVTYTYDDTDPALQYSGNWTHAANQGFTSGDYMNTESYSGQAGDSATVAFNGTAVRWIGSRTSNHGLADVYVDGTKQATVDTSGGQDQAVLFSESGLTNGPHTLKIVVDGTHSAGSTANYVSIDAIDVPIGSATSSTSTSFYTGAASNSFSVETTGYPAAGLTASGPGSGALPAGVSFTDNGDGTGTLSGHSASLVPGTYPITLTAQNSQGSSAQTLMLTVAAGAPPAPTTGVIAGTITDASGRRLAGVCAHVFAASSLPGYTGNNYAPATYQACSGSDGSYAIPLVTPGSARYNVQFIDQNARYLPQWYGDTSGPGTAALKGYNHPGTPVTVTANATTTVDATMQPIPSGITVNGPAVPTRSSAGTAPTWSISGTITVTNHNNVPLTGVTVTDSVNDPNARCVVTGGTGATIAASPLYPGALVTAAFPYTCTYSAPPSTVNEVDRATATWDPSTHVPNGSYQYTQPFRTRP